MGDELVVVRKGALQQLRHQLHRVAALQTKHDLPLLRGQHDVNRFAVVAEQALELGHRAGWDDDADLLRGRLGQLAVLHCQSEPVGRSHREGALLELDLDARQHRPRFLRSCGESHPANGHPKRGRLYLRHHGVFHRRYGRKLRSIRAVDVRL